MLTTLRIVGTLSLLTLGLGCGARVKTEQQVPAAQADSEPTPPEVLEQITRLGGTCKLNAQGRVAVLSFHRCPLKDGDLELVRQTPDVWTMNLRGVSVVGGTLTAEGLKPMASLKNLRRLDLSSNRKLSGSFEVARNWRKLEFLNLSGTQLHDQATEPLAGLPELRTLEIGMSSLTEKGMRTLHGSRIEEIDYWRRDREDSGVLGGFKHLKKWFVGYRYVRVDRLQEYAGMDQLEDIKITCFDVDTPEESIRALRTMTALTSVEIACRPDFECPLLAALVSLPQLKSLRLSAIGDRGIMGLPELVQVEQLDLTGNTRVTEEGLQVLQRLPHLRGLDLSLSRTTSDALRAVAEHSQLERLSFRTNYQKSPPPPGFQADDLRPVLEGTAIRELYVPNAGFGDEITTVVTLAPHLEKLGIGGSFITDTGLLQLRQLKQLKWLDVSGSQVSYQAIDELVRHFAGRDLTLLAPGID